MNNFTIAEDYIERAKLEAESINNDIYIIAEINGIQIYFHNARYQFFHGVKVLQEMFEKLENFKAEREENPEYPS